MKKVSEYSIILVLFFFTKLFCQSITLPVELVYFKSQVINISKVLLSWETATETNCYGFNVERTLDTTTWETIGFVHGNEQSNSPKDYLLIDTTVTFGNIYFYRLKQIDDDGSFKYSDTITVSLVTGIRKLEHTIPANFSVSPNYPNPFNPSTNIDVQIPESGKLMLHVYDLRGRLVFIKNYGERFSGEYTISFDGSNLSSGVYYYTISAGKFRQTRAMVLIK